MNECCSTWHFIKDDDDDDDDDDVFIFPETLPVPIPPSTVHAEQCFGDRTFITHGHRTYPSQI